MLTIPHQKRQADFFAGGARMQMSEAIDLTVSSLSAYAPGHPHWAVAWSGGKDSTATLTLLLWLLESGQIDRPQSLTILYADTRQELPPLAIAAHQIIAALQAREIPIRIAMAPLDKRFLVYMLGRGVPPPNNNTLRWCTRQIKVDPMVRALEAVLPNDDSTLLTITGVRQGESAIRDRRIEMSCSKDGAECGQGWYQQILPEAKGIRGRIATLAPLLHWRVCHVWDWLRFNAPDHGWPTALIAEAYGGDEAQETNARTGCIGCPLAQKEAALESILKMPQWAYLEPLLRLKPIYRQLRDPSQRLRKPGIERLQNGAIASHPQRMGPLTFEARQWALDGITGIQDEINEVARQSERPTIDILNAEEATRIRELIAAGTWPDGWTGDEPIATTPMHQIFQDGATQSDFLISL